MVMSAMRKGAAGGILKFFLFGLLALAAGGLVFTDVGGFFRGGGVSRSDVAKIGDQTISIQQFDLLARRTLRNYGMSPQQAYEAGYMNELLGSEVRTRLLAQKAEDTGLYVGTKIIAEKVRQILAPLTQPGQSTDQVLQQVLAAQSMDQRSFSNSIRREMEVEQLGKAVASGFSRSSETMISDLARFEKENRSIEFIPILTKDFKEAQPATDEELQSMYEATKEAYTNPETRSATLIMINSDAGDIEINDEEALVVYNRNISFYTEPAGRSIEQVIINDIEKAQAIAEKVESGTALKAAVNDIMGNTTDYIPAQRVTQESLPDELKEPVFSGEVNDVIGPVSTALGEQIVVISSIDAEKVQSFDSVKKAIKDELKETKTIDAQYDLANTIDDMLASGASPEEIKEVADIEIKSLPQINSMGIGKNGKNGLETYGDDAASFMQAIFELNEGESSPVFELKDGRMAAIVLDKITPKSYQDFSELKDQLAQQWLNNAQRTQNRLAVLEILTEVQTDDLALKDVAQKHGKQIQRLDNIVRGKKAPAPLTPVSMSNIFEANENEIIAIEIEGGSALARIVRVDFDETYNAAEKEKALPNIIKSFQNESHAIYLSNAHQDIGVDINQDLLDQLYGIQDNTY